MKPVSRTKRQAGFTVVEAIGYLLVFAVLMAALTSLMSSLFTSQARPQVTVSGQAYELAPSYSNLRQAIDLHAALTLSIDQADNIIVVGGTRSHPSLDPTGPSTALATSFTPTTLSAMVGGDTFDSFSSWNQRQTNSTQFSGQWTSSPNSADFTLLTVQGASRITSITQQRRTTTAVSGKTLILYEVTSQQIDWTTGVAVLTNNASTGTTPTYFYRFYYASGEDTWSTPPGASHNWYRTDATWNRTQEGPAKVVFADPYIVSGDDSTGQINSVSRFIYFVPQVQ